MTDAEPPTSTLGAVQIWRVSLSLPEGAVACLEGFLNIEERRRVQQFHFRRDQCRYAISRAALRFILARYLNHLPEELVFGYGAYGKPYLSNPPAGHKVQFNLSHCQDLTLIAVSSTRQLGIDVEKVRDISEAQLIARQYFSAEERGFVESAGNSDRLAAFAKIWTRREATAKALGLDLAAALSRLHIPVYEPGAVARFDRAHRLRERHDVRPQRLDAGTAGGSGTQWFLQDLPLDPSHVGAICVEGDPCPIVSYDFDGLSAGN